RHTRSDRDWSSDVSLPICRQRGGLALRRVIQPRKHACVFSGSAERFVHRPWGLFGGSSGQAGSFCVRRADGSEERLPNKPAGVADRKSVVVGKEYRAERVT